MISLTEKIVSADDIKLQLDMQDEIDREQVALYGALQDHDEINGEISPERSPVRDSIEG